MKIPTEEAMLQLGQKVATQLNPPAVLELVGDVGTGKTTFTRGLAAGLGVSDPVTSPSFTISKRYAFTAPDGAPAELAHYDFYRLSDPGLMRDELAEALQQPNQIIVIEWGGDVADLLPETKFRLEFSLNPDGSRNIKPNSPAQFIEDL